jgi:hypothetical protein
MELCSVCLFCSVYFFYKVFFSVCIILAVGSSLIILISSIITCLTEFIGISVSGEIDVVIEVGIITIPPKMKK